MSREPCAGGRRPTGQSARFYLYVEKAGMSKIVMEVAAPLAVSPRKAVALSHFSRCQYAIVIDGEHDIEA